MYSIFTGINKILVLLVLPWLKTKNSPVLCFNDTQTFFNWHVQKRGTNSTVSRPIRRPTVLVCNVWFTGDSLRHIVPSARMIPHSGCTDFAAYNLHVTAEQSNAFTL